MTRYSGNDFYCDVALPRREPIEVVFEDKDVLAFHHTRPFWPVHIVVVPMTNLGDYQDSKHLHVHIRAGEALRPVS